MRGTRVRVEYKKPSTVQQLLGRKKRAAEKQARAYEAAGNTFMAQAKRREARQFGQAIREANGQPTAPTETTDKVLRDARPSVHQLGSWTNGDAPCKDPQMYWA